VQIVRLVASAARSWCSVAASSRSWLAAAGLLGMQFRHQALQVTLEVAFELELRSAASWSCSVAASSRSWFAARCWCWCGCCTARCWGWSWCFAAWSWSWLAAARLLGMKLSHETFQVSLEVSLELELWSAARRSCFFAANGCWLFTANGCWLATGALLVEKASGSCRRKTNSNGNNGQGSD